uniref:Uncharacterized protein n=1 Tax=Arundo donax TaxID=35708 RepID=A0A0A9AIX1_ARUDO
MCSHSSIATRYNLIAIFALKFCIPP